MKTLSKIATNCGRFVSSQMLGRGLIPQKVVPKLSCLPRGTSRGKVSWGYSRSPKVIGAHTPNLKPIFECSLLKIVGETPVPLGVCASKPLSFSRACKKIGAGSAPRGDWKRGSGKLGTMHSRVFHSCVFNAPSAPYGAEIWSSEKVDLGGSESACSTVLLVDQSSPDFFRRTRKESPSVLCLSYFGYLYWWHVFMVDDALQLWFCFH